MSHSLVIELQKLASSDHTDVATLLRKALLVAGKLGLSEFREWINSELNGYAGGTVPDYRKTRAQLRARNPFFGLVPFIIADARLADLVQKVEIRDPIGNLVHLLESDQSDGMLVYPLPDEIVALLMQGQGFAPLTPVRLLSTGAVAAIIDSVRTKILDWALQLEANGILGEEMQFTSDEKERATAAQQSIHIQNFQGILGSVDGQSHVIQNLQVTITPGDFASLATYLRSAKVSDADINELKTALAEDPTPASSSTIGRRTSEWIGKMVSKAAIGAWNVSVGAASNLLAAAILQYYGIK